MEKAPSASRKVGELEIDDQMKRAISGFEQRRWAEDMETNTYKREGRQ